MTTFAIPNESGVARQLNINDTAGELWSSLNIDLHTNPGKIKMARPLKQVATSDDIGDNPVEAFAILGGNPYALTSSTLYKTTSFDDYEIWAEEESMSATACDDMVVFMGQLVITNGGNMHAYNGSALTSNWWTARGNPSLDSGINHFPHVMEVLRIGAETLAVTDGDQVHAYTGGISSGAILSSTVELGSSFVATCLKGTIRNCFIGSFTEDGEQAYVFEWDGSSTNYTQSYPVGAKAVLAMELIDNVPLIITERGELKMFNNAGFTTVAQFPFAMKPTFSTGVTTGIIQQNNQARPIHPKGMRRVGNVVLIFVAFDNLEDADDLPIDNRTPGGIWAFDISTRSLTHLCSPENSQYFVNCSPLMVVNDSLGRIFCGGRLPNSDTGYGIWLEDLDPTTENYGYFVTSEIEPNTVKDIFNESVIKSLMGENDAIVVKYRYKGDVQMPVSAEAVWVSATKFNTTADLSRVKERYDLGDRDEVEVLYGQGAARLAHITDLVENNNTYEVTIDESIGASGETSQVRIDTFKKIPKTMDLSKGEIERFGLGDSGAFVQLKVGITGRAGLPETRSLMVFSKTKEKTR